MRLARTDRAPPDEPPALDAIGVQINLDSASMKSDSASRALSHIIGRIYDCALDVDQWDSVLDQIREILRCQHAFLRLDDLVARRTTITKCVGVDAYWQQQHADFASEVMSILVEVLSSGHPIDLPTIASKVLSKEQLFATRYASEWGRPQGLVDFMGLFLMTSPSRIAALELGRNERDGDFSSRDADVATLLIPHLRRSLTISNAINIATIGRERLADTLDAISLGVVLADEESQVVHANRAAESMMREGSVVGTTGGRLRAGHAQAAAEVRSAIEIAARNEDGLGKTGLAVRLTEQPDNPVVAHVLPLARGELRTKLDPTAIAAVFINPSREDHSRVDALKSAYRLTPAETRVLAELLSGSSLIEAAGRLSIAPTTARTHLDSIFSKTNTSRQAELMLLAARVLVVGPQRAE